MPLTGDAIKAVIQNTDKFFFDRSDLNSNFEFQVYFVIMQSLFTLSFVNK